MSDAPQVQVVATEEAPPEGEVLAEAAVASAALSGAAAVEAGHAGQEAAEANAKADAALASSAAVASQAVDEARVQQLIDEGISKSNAELAQALSKMQAPAPPAGRGRRARSRPRPRRTRPPASFKPQKRKTVAERYAVTDTATLECRGRTGGWGRGHCSFRRGAV